MLEGPAHLEVSSTWLLVRPLSGFSAQFLPFPWFLDLLMTPCDFFFLVYVELEMDT